jgi:hypothetical protein
MEPQDFARVLRETEVTIGASGSNLLARHLLLAMARAFDDLGREGGRPPVVEGRTLPEYITPARPVYRTRWIPFTRDADGIVLDPPPGCRPLSLVPAGSRGSRYLCLVEERTLLCACQLAWPTSAAPPWPAGVTSPGRPTA